MKTELEQQLQTEDALSNVQAYQPYDLLPNQGGTIPTFYQDDKPWQEAYKSGKLVNPPSTKEINKQMWIGSFMTALIVGLTTKDAGAALAGGLLGGIAIHDHGYTLRKRAEHVPQMQKDGYSAQAIVQWYRTGDQSNLDRERDDLLARDKFKEANRDDDRNFEERVRQFNENAEYRDDSLQVRREGQASNNYWRQQNYNQRQRNFDTRMEAQRETLIAQGKAGERADKRLVNNDKRLLNQQLNGTLRGPQQKYYYNAAAEKALADLERYIKSNNPAGAQAAYNNYRTNATRAQVGGNATLTADALDSVTGMPAWGSDKWNKLNILVNGMPSAEWVKMQRAAVRDDVKNDYQTMRQFGESAYNVLVQQEGVSEEEANVMVDSAFIGAGLGDVDWSSDEPPALKDSPADDAQASGGDPLAVGESHTSSEGVEFKRVK